MRSRPYSVAIAGSTSDSMLSEFDLERLARSTQVETQVV
jgi:hypothetical protein